MSRWIHELTWPDVAEYLERGDTALLPVGAVEQHGPHCPLMTDIAEAMATAEGVAERADALIAPPIYPGWSPHHMAFPGTITLRPETLTRLVEDTCHSLVCHGFKHILVINGHRVANLPPLQIAVTRVRNVTGAAVALVDIALVAGKEIREVCESPPNGVGHGCESETSFMLYKFGDRVRMERAEDRIAPVGEFERRFITPDHATNMVENVKVFFPQTIEEAGEANAGNGAAGAPTLASAGKGERIYEAIVGNTARFVEEFQKTPVAIKGTFPPI
ncbi:MAG: creatininase family protein [bacterium]